VGSSNATTKNALRSTYLKKRKALSSPDREKFSLDIANTCLKLPVWHLQVFHIYLSIPQKYEVDTSFLLTVLQGKDKEIVVPKVEASGKLSHYLLTDSTRLEISKWGVPEPLDGFEVAPERMEVIFLPLLAYDEQGYRVGYGGGYYDRFLEGCRQDVVKVGLSFFPPDPQISDLHEGDVPLDYCVTPTGIYSF
jgi:5-formyltetrahydrofolate cyclo-ligase